MLRLSEMIKEVEEWLDQFTYDASISMVVQISDWEYKAYRITYEEGIEADEGILTVYSNGIIKNTNNEDVCETALNANDDEETKKWIMNFQNKYRRENK